MTSRSDSPLSKQWNAPFEVFHNHRYWVTGFKGQTNRLIHVLCSAVQITEVLPDLTTGLEWDQDYRHVHIGKVRIDLQSFPNGTNSMLSISRENWIA